MIALFKDRSPATIFWLIILSIVVHSNFFVNPPLASLSGALAPIEAMPHWLQPFTILNPIRHFGVITRGAMVKGSGFAELWPNFLALVLFATVLMSVSVWRFRKQLG